MEIWEELAGNKCIYLQSFFQVEEKSDSVIVNKKSFILIAV